MSEFLLHRVRREKGALSGGENPTPGHPAPTPSPRGASPLLVDVAALGHDPIGLIGRDGGENAHCRDASVGAGRDAARWRRRPRREEGRARHRLIRACPVIQSGTADGSAQHRSHAFRARARAVIALGSQNLQAAGCRSLRTPGCSMPCMSRCSVSGLSRTTSHISLSRARGAGRFDLSLIDDELRDRRQPGGRL